MTELAQTSELRTLLAKAGGDYVKAYDALVEEQTSKVLVAKRTTVEHRKIAWRNALARRDKGVLREAYNTLRGYVAKARDNAVVCAEETPGVLDVDQAEALMSQFIDLRRIEAMVKADREAIKERVSASMTEDMAAQGEEFPEHVNASIDVPALGYRFSREGQGRKDPTLDEAKLAELLGEQLWSQVSTEEIIPEQRIRKLNIPLLMQRAAQDRNEALILEHLRESLVVGGFKPGSFTIREL
jgi:hypothetical protein